MNLAEYLASTRVHVDGGKLCGLIRNMCPDTRYGAKRDLPTSSGRRLTLSQYGDGLHLEWELLTCPYDHEWMAGEMIIPYRVSPDVEFVRSGYTIYPIEGSMTRPIKSAMSAVPPWDRL